MNDLAAHIHRQRKWSEQTFGPGDRSKGVVDHIRKELREIEDDPASLEEWVDVILLAIDGAWRNDHSPEAIAFGLAAKQAKNEAREWPDWRTLPTDKAIEHVKVSMSDDQTETENNLWVHPKASLEAEIRAAINKHSAENGSDTPDFILAQFLIGCLNVFDGAVRKRTEWYGLVF